MPTPNDLRRVRALTALVCATTTFLAACGGGGGGGEAAPAPSPTPAPPSAGPIGAPPPPPTGNCAADGQKEWLRSYMASNYFWTASSPDPAPSSVTSLDDYLNARLYTGSDPAFPAADRWTDYETTESFNRFFGSGQTRGYGLALAGLEVTGAPDQPLYVRYVAPGSPAAAAGVQRGDQVISMNGHAASEYISADNYSVLTPAAVGERLDLVLRNGGADRNVSLTSADYALTPVEGTQVLTTPGGRKLGYVLVNNMISQAETPLKTAFSTLKAQGAQDVVLDMRYNGGGVVSTASVVGSLVGGAPKSGQPFAKLLFNAQNQGKNLVYNFGTLSQAMALPRVYVLTGERTCSASEQVINGLRGVGVDVVAVGDTTCGKPVGSVPVAGACGAQAGAAASGLTFSIVNFETTNALNQGRYFNGFQATCQVAENFGKPLGATDDPLMVAAAAHADSGACPAGTASAREQAQARSNATARVRIIDGDSNGGAFAR